MILLTIDTIKNILTKLGGVLAYVAPVVNAIVLFMLPLLGPMGDALRSFIVTILGYITIGNYTWFIVITSVAGVAAIVLAFLFPGEKAEKK